MMNKKIEKKLIIFLKMTSNIINILIFFYYKNYKMKP